MEFVAIDFETATGSNACAVGIVTFKNGKIIDEFHTLIKPPNNEYNWHTIQVHGINPSDTVNSPNFSGIYNEIKKRIAGKTVVAHNESFDRNVLIKNMALYGLDYTELALDENWQCTMKICKASDRYPNGKLNECCAVDNIELNHHEALSDARACGLLYLNNIDA